MTFVLAATVQQAGNQALPHLVFEAASGMVHRDRGDVPSRPEQLALVLADKRECQRFEKSTRRKQCPNNVAHLLTLAFCSCNDWKRGIFRNLVVAMNSSDLFDQIAFTSQVEPPCRRGERGRIGSLVSAGQAQLFQNVNADVRGDVDTQDSQDLVETQNDGWAVRRGITGHN